MAVFALWSAPRARSTAFFRSMAERGDMTVLHEPFCNLRDYGETDAGARTFDSSLSLLAWLRDETQNMRVFLKDHPPAAYVRDVLADRRFLAEARHAFLIRRPEQIAASNYALWPGMNITAIGLERLCEVQAAVRDAGGDASVVIDSDDLVTRPGATMAAYCAAVGLPFIPRALTWSPVNGLSGAGPHAGTRTSAPAPASSGASACTRTPSRTPASWPGSPPTTGRSTSGSTHSGWT
jgi:hypothetical protein